MPRKKPANYKPRRSLIGLTFYGVTVLAKTDERGPANQIIYLVRCDTCLGTTRSRASNFTKARARRFCKLCRAKQYTEAVENPLELTDAQTAQVLRSARIAVFCTLGAEHGFESVDDIIAQTMLEILSRGNTVRKDDIGGLSYKIAATLARRTWNSGPKFIEPIWDADLGEFRDVFDDLEYEPPDPIDDLELEKYALEVLTPEEHTGCWNIADITGLTPRPIKGDTRFWSHGVEILTSNFWASFNRSANKIGAHG